MSLKNFHLRSKYLLKYCNTELPKFSAKFDLFLYIPLLYITHIMHLEFLERNFNSFNQSYTSEFWPFFHTPWHLNQQTIVHRTQNSRNLTTEKKCYSELQLDLMYLKMNSFFLNLNILKVNFFCYHLTFTTSIHNGSQQV